MTAPAKHTPGPWTVHGRRAGLTIRDAKDRPVAEPWLTDISHDEREANARLIAAAPELLAALYTVLGSDMAQREEDEGRVSDTLNTLRAAIAKARGEA